MINKLISYYIIFLVVQHKAELNLRKLSDNAPNELSIST